MGDMTKHTAAQQAAWKAFKKSFRRGLTRELNTDLTEDEFMILVLKPCVYCGVAGSHVRNVRGTSFSYNGIDRLDSRGNYTKDNIAPCCRTCNVAKSTMSVAEFVSWIYAVSNHLRAKSVEIIKLSL